ncbi:hypothetical protein H0G86_003745 [Trichoderma simmonsii]|uniref:Uncharacterized protein n=1 Tax=Trichoderma simmonsii TaxID=1491479 RepID=A0A8G0LBC2_9HYPO|nr:hypothetical protein H0G86_003745 [Trichoderma simmonsii]
MPIVGEACVLYCAVKEPGHRIWSIIRGTVSGRRQPARQGEKKALPGLHNLPSMSLASLRSTTRDKGAREQPVEVKLTHVARCSGFSRAVPVVHTHTCLLFSF